MRITNISRPFAALLFLTTASPAHAEPEPFIPGPDHAYWVQRAHIEDRAVKWEIAYQALNLIDAAETLDCLHRHVCQEANPLFGKHPSTGRLIGTKVALGLVQYFVWKRTFDRVPSRALKIAQISAVVQGGVVAANLRFVF